MARMRPVIGMTTYVEQARYTYWDVRASLLPQDYVRHVAGAGALPVLLPPSPANAELVERLDTRLDGLLLTGGADIDPARYGASPHPATAEPRPDRDTGETALLEAALARGLPILGICRGMQLLAVVCGGSLHQHLPDHFGGVDHSPRPGTFGRHAVTLAEGSRARAILGERVDVPTHHHQAVAVPGSLVVSGRADDGVVEAVEDPVCPFVLGVQWHPEVGEDGRLFEAFVTACRGQAL